MSHDKSRRKEGSEKKTAWHSLEQQEGSKIDKCFEIHKPLNRLVIFSPLTSPEAQDDRAYLRYLRRQDIGCQMPNLRGYFRWETFMGGH